MEKLLYTSLVVICLCFAGTANADLLGQWDFEGNADDSSGNGNNGTLENGASLSDDTPTGAGQSLALAGGDQHVLVPHDASLDVTSAITIAAWVKTSNEGWDGILAKSPSDGSDANHAGNYELRIENGSRGVHFLYQKGGMNDTEFHLNEAVTIADNEWTHVAITAEVGGNVDYYINGSLAGTHENPVADGFAPTNTNPLYIGSRADLFTTMDGYLDEVRIYNEVLGAGEIAGLAVIPEPSTGLMGLLALAMCGLIRRRR